MVTRRVRPTETGQFSTHTIGRGSNLLHGQSVAACRAKPGWCIVGGWAPNLARAFTAVPSAHPPNAPRKHARLPIGSLAKLGISVCWGSKVRLNHRPHWATP